MKPEEQKELSELFAKLPGTENWPKIQLTAHDGGYIISKREWDDLPWLPGRGYWQPAEVLRRAGATAVYWQYQHETGELEDVVSLDIKGEPLIHGWPALPTFEDCMRALGELAKLTLKEGGVFMEAWMDGCKPEREE